MKKLVLIALPLLSFGGAMAALPTILVNSATGSDTTASGAGPGTAISGAACVTAGDGLSVVISGLPNISAVPTDGSAVLFLADTAAGARNFSVITATNDTTDTVTVASAFAAADTDACAVGGKRASVFGTTSLKLFDNNGGNGDALAGWVMQMESGHAETYATTQNFYRPGDTTNGLITLKGADGAATRPVVTYSGASQGFIPRAQYWLFQGFDLLASNTAGLAVDQTATNVYYKNMRFEKSGGGSFTGFDNGDFGGILLNSEIGHMQGAAITASGSVAFTIKGCWIHDPTGNGVTVVGGDMLGGDISDNLFDTIGGDAINWPLGSATNRSANISGNDFYNITSDAIESTNGASDAMANVRIFNNNASIVGGYGFKSAGTLAALQASGLFLENNNFHSCTSGTTLPTGLNTDGYSVDPQFTDGPNSDFRIGTNLKALGFPAGAIGLSPTNNYLDIGAVQRIEPSSSGTTTVPAPGISVGY